jgi:hypothetical protein
MCQVFYLLFRERTWAAHDNGVVNWAKAQTVNLPELCCGVLVARY